MSSTEAPSAGAPRAAIVAPAGEALTPEEAGAYRRLDPLGFILFGRNCVEPDQARRLVADLRASVGRPDAPVLIDQEGGRVARLRPPAWPAFPAARRIGELAEADPAAGEEAAWLHARLIAFELHALGIDVNCAPVLDAPDAACHAVVGDRGFSADPERVARLGGAACAGYAAGGVLPVVKHVPGHGRARADSHLELPVVDAPADVLLADAEPFRRLASSPFAMTAHIRYTALDAARPATQSAAVLEGFVRGRLGFEGALVTDDISMKALGGTLAERVRAALDAGCDLALYCRGDLGEAVEVLEAAGRLRGRSLARVDAALARRRPPAPLDPAAAARRLNDLLARAALA